MGLRRQYKFICFCGLDGSGKSSQASALAEYFEKNNIRSRYVWIGWSPTILKYFLRFIKRMFLAKNKVNESNYEQFTELKRSVFKSKLLQNTWLSYMFIDYYLQVLFKIVIPIVRNEVVVCDRYIYDIMINVAINYKWSSVSLAQRFQRFPLRIFPKPDKIFLIDVSEEIAFKRKNDISSVNYLIDRRNLYKYLSPEIGMVMINGNDTIENVHREILDSLALPRTSSNEPRK